MVAGDGLLGGGVGKEYFSAPHKLHLPTLDGSVASSPNSLFTGFKSKS